MDLSSLAELGKIAGLAGLAIGMIVLLVRPIVEQASSLSEAQRGPLFRIVAIGAFSVGAIGIVAWAVAGMNFGPAVTSGGCGIATSSGATTNTINCDLRPAETRAPGTNAPATNAPEAKKP